VSDITGEVAVLAVLEGTVQAGKSYPEYEGNYEIAPSSGTQVLATRNRILTEDIRVKEIAYQEVTNKSGGQTVTIGGN